MNKVLAVVVATVFAAPAHAQDRQDPFGGFVNGGITFGSISEEDDPKTYSIDTNSGTGLNLTGGLRFKPGIMVRVGFDNLKADGGTACLVGSGCADFTDTITARETRLGVFYAPPIRRVVSFRAGLGYERVTLAVESLGNSKSDGGFVEGAVLVNAGKIVTFDIGGAVLSLTDEDGNDVTGAEFAVSAVFHAGPVDIGIGGRGLHFESDASGSTTSDDFTEGRVTIGGKWGYGSGR